MDRDVEFVQKQLKAGREELNSLQYHDPVLRAYVENLSRNIDELLEKLDKYDVV